MKLPLLLSSLLLLARPVLHAETNGMGEFLKTKYGFFVHYVWGGSQDKQFTCFPDGTRPATFDALADAFDAPGLASDLEKWGVEYLILTAWHYNINPLFPSKTMKKWGLEKHTCKRDVLREVITACKAKGIKVILYTHPRDGHDLQYEDQLKTGWGGPNGVEPKWENFDRKKWNDFTSELYQELITRYGDDIIGIYSDEGTGAADSYRVVDYPRLRRVVKSLQPDLMMVQNFYGSYYSLDVGDKEYSHSGDFSNRDGNAWPAWRNPVTSQFGSDWYAKRPAGENVVPFKAEDMFRYTILQAGANHEGSGVHWAAGNYAGGGWEPGVRETMEKLADYIRPIASSIKGVYASTSWPTAQGTKIPDLKWGGVATRATDDSVEYLHILNPPVDGSTALTLPPPADGKKFEKAVLLVGSQPCALRQDADGINLQLPEGRSWDKFDTVIALKVAANSPQQNLSLWKAFRGSSFQDPVSRETSAYAFYSVDGDPSTAWVSRPVGLTEGNEPIPPDRRPECRIDLGESARLSRIEVLGFLGAGVRVSVSASSDFKKAKTLAISESSKLDTLEVNEATYGAGDQMVDVTEQVRTMMALGMCSLRAGNHLCTEDPAPNQGKELRLRYTFDGKDETKVIPERESITLREVKTWTIDIPAGTSARFVRLQRIQDGPPLVVNEFRVFGKFE